MEFLVSNLSLSFVGCAVGTCILIFCVCGVILGRFPGEHGLVAPGLSCQYPIKFAPDSLADYDDVIKVTVRVN